MLVLLLLATLGGESTHARHHCLVEETRYLGSSPGGSGPCRVSEELKLSEGLFTFPYLGTRSYRVSYWKGSVVIPGSVTRTYVTRLVDRCHGWMVDKDYRYETIDTSETRSLENPNLDERIDDEAKLAPLSETEAKAAYARLLEGCGAAGAR